MPHRHAERRVRLVQGEWAVSDHPGTVLSTILGSCIAACMRDPVAGVGGMNHFLLPDGGCPRPDAPERYGVHLMELLVNGLLSRGARRERLEVKLFGGARTVAGLSDIGARNARFARTFVENEGFALLDGSLGGTLGRRIEFWPVSGRARQLVLRGPVPTPAETTARPAAPSAGDCEFF
jgi:chemotaxis protein CheD